MSYDSNNFNEDTIELLCELGAIRPSESDDQDFAEDTEHQMDVTRQAIHRLHSSHLCLKQLIALICCDSQNVALATAITDAQAAIAELES
jgi:hypothetical protein